MREEILNWWKQAKKDFETAKHNKESGDHYAAVFFLPTGCGEGVESFIHNKKRGFVGSDTFFALSCERMRSAEKFFHLFERINA